MSSGCRFEIDSEKDAWIGEDALKKMSLKQVDLFFEIAHSIAFYSGSWSVGYDKSSSSIEENKIFGVEFVANRIDRKFRFGFSSETSSDSVESANVKNSFESVRISILFVLSGIGDDRRKKFVSAYASFYNDPQPFETAEYAYDLWSKETMLRKWREMLWTS